MRVRFPAMCGWRLSAVTLIALINGCDDARTAASAPGVTQSPTVGTERPVVGDHAFKQLVTIIGRAEDAKLGAVVIDPHGDVPRYIDGLARWPDAVRGQSVCVTGTWSWRPGSPMRSDAPPAARIGAHVVIVDPEWELVLNDS